MELFLCHCYRFFWPLPDDDVLQSSSSSSFLSAVHFILIPFFPQDLWGNTFLHVKGKVHVFVGILEFTVPGSGAIFHPWEPLPPPLQFCTSGAQFFFSFLTFQVVGSEVKVMCYNAQHAFYQQ